MAVRERRNSGPEGLAEVRILTKSIRVSFQDGDEYDLPLGAIEDGRKSGLYRVSMSADKTNAYLHPTTGQYIFSFKQMGNRTVGKVQGDPNSGLPTHKMTAGGIGHRKDGRTFPIPRELVFYGQFQIESDGLYQGMVASTQLPYIFAAPVQGEACDFEGSQRNLKRLELLFNTVGNFNIAMDTAPFSYDPDPTRMLLSVEKYLKSCDKQFLGQIGERGFFEIDSVSSIPAELMPKKKAAKKKSTKK